MLKYIISKSKSITIYDLHEALTKAGVNETDDVFTQDQALESLFEGQRVKRLTYCLSSYSADLEIAVREGVEVLILIKEIQ